MTAPRLLARLLAVLLLHALLACLILSTALAAQADDTPTVSHGKARGGIPRGEAALNHPAGAAAFGPAFLSARVSDTACIGAQAAGRVQFPLTVLPRITRRHADASPGRRASVSVSSVPSVVKNFGGSASPNA